jgi:hypothetical protein
LIRISSKARDVFCIPKALFDIPESYQVQRTKGVGKAQSGQLSLEKEKGAVFGRALGLLFTVALFIL